MATSFERYPKVFDYKLCLTGTMGAGKSTILQLLSDTFTNFNIYTHNENWVSDFVGLELLKRKISGKVSINTFQNYVIDEFTNGLNITPLHNNKPSMHLHERSIDDTIYSFCNFAYLKGQLSRLEFEVLFNRACAAQLRYKVPSYNCTRNFCLLKSSEPNNDLKIVEKIINNDIYKDGIEQRIIGLDITDEQSISRVRERGRIGEDKYSDAHLIEFNQYYKKLFKYLGSDNTVSSVDDLLRLIN
jgi:deoxyadenosine/deoxycytidine kinase